MNLVTVLQEMKFVLEKIVVLLSIWVKIFHCCHQFVTDNKVLSGDNFLQCWKGERHRRHLSGGFFSLNHIFLNDICSMDQSICTSRL